MAVSATGAAQSRRSTRCAAGSCQGRCGVGFASDKENAASTDGFEGSTVGVGFQKRDRSFILRCREEWRANNRSDSAADAAFDVFSEFKLILLAVQSGDRAITSEICRIVECDFDVGTVISRDLPLIIRAGRRGLSEVVVLDVKSNSRRGIYMKPDRCRAPLGIA